MTTGYVRGAKRDVMHYLKEHTNQVITLQDLMQALPQWEDRQLLNTMNGLLKTYEGLTKQATGVWKHVENDGQDKKTFTILKETDEYYLLMDDEGHVYRAVYLG